MLKLNPNLALSNVLVNGVVNVAKAGLVRLGSGDASHAAAAPIPQPCPSTTPQRMPSDPSEWRDSDAETPTRTKRHGLLGRRGRPACPPTLRRDYRAYPSAGSPFTAAAADVGRDRWGIRRL